MTDPSVFIRARSILNPDYFDNTPLHSNKTCINFFHKLYEKYESLGDPTLVNIALKEKNPQEDGYNKIEHWNKIDDSDRLLKQIETYCKHKACVKAAMKVYEKVNKGQTSDVIKILEDAVLLKLPTDFGVNVFGEADSLLKQLEELHSTQYELKTGWNELDSALAGGFGYGEIEVFAGASGAGKSIVLANLGLNYAKQGLNVMYFSLELNEILTKKRIISMLTGYPIRNMKGNEINVTYSYNNIMKQIGWENVGDYNILQIANGSNTLDIETIINEYEIKTGKIVNVIIVDYADLMSPCQNVSRENIHLSEKFIYEELRGLVSKRTKCGKKSVILTASQLGKGALNSELNDINQDALAGSAGKNFTCDTLWAIQSTPAMKEKGIFKLKALKTRNSSYTKDIELAYNIDTLRIDNPDISKSGNATLDNTLQDVTVKDITPFNNANQITNTIVNDIK